MKDPLEQLLTRTYRNELWSKFIKAIKDEKLLKENDKINLIIHFNKHSFLKAKLFQILHRHSDFKFSLKFTFIYKDREELKKIKEHLELFEFLNEELEFSNNEEYDCEKVYALDSTYDDVITHVLKSMLMDGTYSCILPKYKVDNVTFINPLFYIRDKVILRFFNAFDNKIPDKVLSEKETYIRNLINELMLNNEFSEKNIFVSMRNVNLDKLLSYKINDKLYELNSYYEKRKI